MNFCQLGQVDRERQHWLQVSRKVDYKSRHISDPNISTDETVKAIVNVFNKPRSVLEIGCGYGRLMTEIKKLYPNARVSGIDVNPDLVKEAKQSGLLCYARDNLTGVAKKDVIYSVAVFQHLPDRQKTAYVNQSFNTLYSGGVLRVQFIEGERNNFLDHWVTADRMTGWFKEAGFKVDQLVERGLAHPQWSWITGVKP